MGKRIPFDSLVMAASVAELQVIVTGQIQKVSQPDHHTIILTVYSGQECHVVLSGHPDYARVHLASRRPRSPKTPLAFCQTLRKWIDGGRIEFIRQRGVDRILEIGITTDSGNYQLVGEFMGKHSNLMLVGSDRKLVGALKWVPESKSKRPVLPLRDYSPPPLPERPSILNATENDNLKEFEGISPFLRNLIESGTPLKEVQDAFKKPPTSAFYTPGSGVYPLDPKIEGAILRESIGYALEQYFIDYARSHEIEQNRANLTDQLSRVLHARRNALKGLQAAQEAAAQAPQRQREAELLLAYQGSIPKQASEATVWDFEGNELKLKLNPEKTVVENANLLFEKAKKSKERLSEIVDQSQRIAQDIADLETNLEKLTTTDRLDDIREIKALANDRRWLHRQPVSQKKEDRPFAGFPVRELISPSGWKILYGTNATSNDYVTTKLAKPNDIWLHVRGQTSAHVIIVTQNQPEKVQKEDLLFAAVVSVRNSVAKNAYYVPVDYTLKKYVRKPRGSAPGLAVYEREKTLHVDP